MLLNSSLFVIWIIYLKQTNNLVQLWKSTQDIALGVFAGCMYVTLFVYVYVRFIKKDNL